MAFLEQRDSVTQVLRHLHFAHISDRDILP